MTVSRQFETISLWLDCVARTIVSGTGRFMSPRAVKLVEEAGGTLTVQAPGGNIAGRLQIAGGQVTGRIPEKVAAILRGSRLELTLRPDPFLFRPLELPRRAGEFLAGIVRAQIDRLTPWSADEAVFGWSGPSELGSERIVVTVAATARARVAPYIQALGELGAHSIAVFTSPHDAAAGSAPIKVLEHERRGLLDVQRVRRGLAAVLVVAAILAAAAIGTDVILAANLDSRQEELARKIAERRAMIRAGSGGSIDSVAGAERALERRKHTSPSAVLVLEALSHVLPDHTYVTELRIEADKLRLIGVTQDAPSLIRLIEQTPHFTRATFFAPTTRSPSDTGERFHIEARIEPVFSPPS